MSNTQIVDYVFTIKEGEASRSGADDAPVWLMLEPSRDSLSALPNGYLSLTLATGTKIDRAKEIARYLNENIAGVGFTTL